MAVTYDNSSWQQSASFPGSPTNYTYVVGASADVLYVWVHWALNATPDLVTGITYNGVALSFLADYTSGSGPRGSLWRLRAPATGSNTLAVTHSGLTHAVGIVSLIGAHQTTTEGTISSNVGIAAATSDSLSPASDTGDLILGFLTLNGGTSLTATGTGCTLRVNGNTADSDGPGGAETQDAVTTSTTGGFSWTTGATGVHVRFAVKAASSDTTEQEGARFYADDAGPNSATALASQDTNISRALATNTRLRMLLNATNDPASFSPQLEYNVNSSSYLKVEVVDGAALAYGAVGTITTTGTTAPSVAYPAGITAGQLLIMVVGNRPNASTVDTPNGWTAPSGNTATGGAGSEAAGTGTMRITVFTRVADGTESGSVSLTIGSGTSASACIFRVTRGAGKRFLVALASGADSTAGTAWSVTMGSDPGVTANDLVFVASISSEDTASFASEALSQTGVTFGTMVERVDQNVTTGNDQRLVVAEFPVSSGTSSAAAVYTMTASGTNSANAAGVSMMIRLRQTDAYVVMAASANITASGDNSTAQLTAPAGKSTSDFVTGRVVDDENPADAVDITTDDYTEYEWCFQCLGLAASDTVDFRVTKSGTVLNTYTVTPRITIGAAAYTLTASGTTFALTGQAAGLLAQRRITAAAATYALSGQATAFYRGFYLFAVAGTYTQTGNAQALKQGRLLTAVSGTYALTGRDATLTSGVGLILTAAAGTYTLTGQAAALNRGRRMTAAATTYALTGNATGLRWGHLLTAASATYSYTGNAVTLTAASPPGSYLLTGNAVGLRWAHQLAAATGSYALTGQATGLIRALRMTAATTTYALNGQAVALTKQSTGAYTLGASPGAFTLTGGTTNLRWAHLLASVQGSYTYTGAAVGLLHSAPGGYTMIAEGSAYVLSGQAAGLLRGAAVIATAGTYALTGSAIAFHTTFYLVAQHGVYLLTGQEVAMSGPPPVVVFYPGKYEPEWASALADVRAAGI